MKEQSKTTTNAKRPELRTLSDSELRAVAGGDPVIIIQTVGSGVDGGPVIPIPGK